MKKRLSLLPCSAFVLCGIALAWAMWERNTALAERETLKATVTLIEQKSRTLEKNFTTAHKERDDARDQVKRAQQQLVGAKKQAQSAAKDAAPISARGSNEPGSPTDAKPLNAMGDMMKNPAMRELAKQQQLSFMDGIYSRLYDHFQLDDAERANFKQLLTERTTAEVELGLKMLDDKLTPQQRHAMTKEMDAMKKASSERIKTFLNNDDDYKAFESWEETREERMALTIGASAFADEPLSMRQEQQLVDAMHQIKQSKAASNANQSSRGTSASEQLAIFDADARHLVAHASGFLTPKQIESLKAMQQQWRAIQEVGMKFANQMK